MSAFSPRDARAKQRALTNERNALQARVAALEVELAAARAPQEADEDEDMKMEELGAEPYQDEWDMRNTSRLLESGKNGARVTCRGIEQESGQSMPGVHALLKHERAQPASWCQGWVE